MSNKVTLTYENGKYSVEINGSVVEKDNDLENSFLKFKQVIKNNVNGSDRSWQFIEETISGYENEEIEINSEFKTITLGAMKYFYNTGKVFYVLENKMIPLTGGYELVKFILKTPSINTTEKIKPLLGLCEKAIANKVSYRTSEDSFLIFSAAFNYGSLEYNFATKKINKGIAIESSTFEEFINYTLSIIEK